jgi:hypothetical protein
MVNCCFACVLSAPCHVCLCLAIRKPATRFSLSLTHSVSSGVPHISYPWFHHSILPFGIYPSLSRSLRPQVRVSDLIDPWTANLQAKSDD